MTNGVAAFASLVLCLALAMSQTQPSFAHSNVAETNHGDAPNVLLSSSISSSSSSWVADSLLSQVSITRRVLKVKVKKYKPQRGTWKAGQPTFLGVVITVSVIVAFVILFVLYLLITEKKRQDPKWRLRDLFKRKLKPGVKRTLTRGFTRKTTGRGEKLEATENSKVEQMEKPMVVEDGAPPKMQSTA